MLSTLHAGRGPSAAPCQAQRSLGSLLQPLAACRCPLFPLLWAGPGWPGPGHSQALNPAAGAARDADPSAGVAAGLPAGQRLLSIGKCGFELQEHLLILYAA